MGGFDGGRSSRGYLPSPTDRALESSFKIQFLTRHSSPSLTYSLCGRKAALEKKMMTSSVPFSLATVFSACVT